jgi:hypothetical protein
MKEKLESALEEIRKISDASLRAGDDADSVMSLFEIFHVVQDALNAK